jgi:hypothetical protein
MEMTGVLWHRIELGWNELLLADGADLLVSTMDADLKAGATR